MRGIMNKHEDALKIAKFWDKDFDYVQKKHVKEEDREEFFSLYETLRANIKKWDVAA